MDELRVEFIKWSYGMLKLSINLPSFAYYSSLKARKQIVQLLDMIIGQQKQEMAEGQMRVLTSLLTVLDEKWEFTSESSIKDNLILLLFTGYNTSNNTWL
ncbi:hypothetical protein R1flu_009342 [Riccia fluitans]|uniref:Uncharacterized protein n=1 Tax=Riccia fluitans TaxID=41844 RepID=A0ABD1Z226_9MARC